MSLPNSINYTTIMARKTNGDSNGTSLRSLTVLPEIKMTAIQPRDEDEAVSHLQEGKVNRKNIAHIANEALKIANTDGISMRVEHHDFSRGTGMSDRHSDEKRMLTYFCSPLLRSPSLILAGPTLGSQPLSLPNQAPGLRLNRFVRLLHDMLVAERDSGIVEWRRGLLVLHSTDAFAKEILPKYFNTRNFKTFRRQLNYYGFVHVRSFSTTGTTTTALWVNRELANAGSDDVSAVLLLKRVEPTESAKTAEGRRSRKELAIHTVEEDLGVSAKTLQMDQIRSMALRGGNSSVFTAPISALEASLQPTRQRVPAWQKPIVRRTVSLGSDGVEQASKKKTSENADAANLLLMLSRAGESSSS